MKRKSRSKFLGVRNGMVVFTDVKRVNNQTKFFITCDCGNKKWVLHTTVRSCGCKMGNLRQYPFENDYKAANGSISACDLDLLQQKGLAIVSVHGKKYVRARKLKNGIFTSGHLHRQIMERVLNRRLEKTELVDHIDGNGMNNCRENLRVCSNAENLRNRTKAPSDNKSGAMGVVFCKQTGKWAAEIRLNGKKIWLGRHANKEDAIIARRKAEKEYWGDFAPKWENK